MSILSKMVTDLQRCPWNLNLMTFLEETVVFLSWKVFNSGSFFIASCKQEMHKSPCIEPANRKKNIDLLFHSYLIRQTFKGYQFELGIAIAYIFIIKYINIYVAHGWPNNWTEWAEIFVDTRGWLRGCSRLKHPNFYIFFNSISTGNAGPFS